MIFLSRARAERRAWMVRGYDDSELQQEYAKTGRRGKGAGPHAKEGSRQQARGACKGLVPPTGIEPVSHA